jgi:SAM-dependent methyltransferase
MTESNIANTAQYEYWNTVGGPRWIGLGGLVEQRNLAFNDILLQRSAVASDESVLEVGCGTGASTIPLAAAVGPRGRVVGVDISEPMLAGARQRSPRLAIFCLPHGLVADCALSVGDRSRRTSTG